MKPKTYYYDGGKHYIPKHAKDEVERALKLQEEMLQTMIKPKNKTTTYLIIAVVLFVAWALITLWLLSGLLTL
jgi:hypothetical protein